MNEQTSVLRRGLRLLWLTIRTHPRPFVISVSGASLFSIAAVVGTIVLGRVTDRVIIPAFGEGVDGGTVGWAVVAIVLVAALRSAGVVFRRYWGAMTTRWMQVTWFSALTDRYVSEPLAFFQEQPAGKLLAHADADAERATFAMQPLPFSLGVVVIIVFAVINLAVVDLSLMLIALALFPALAALNRFYTVRVESPAARAQAQVGAVSSVAHESFEGALVVKTLGLEREEQHRLEAEADALRRERLVVGRLRAAFEPALDALPNLGTLAVLGVGAWRVSVDAITTGDVVQAMALFAILAFPMRVVGFLLEELPRAVVAYERISTVVDAETLHVSEPGEPVELPPGPLGVVADDLSFAYGSEPVLDGVDFVVEPGEIVAVVGSTGSGKTTLCHLIARLVTPTRGSLSVGGVDISAASASSMRDAVALVFQESFLFADTLEANLTLGVQTTPQELDTVLEVAQARSIIEGLDHALDEVVGERGVTLSGGQRQRIALARALLRRPRLLLLDDATSAVDPTIEQKILDGLRRTLHTTTLIIAHRVATIALADRVLYLDAGRVAGMGAHDELLRTHEGYAALVRAYDENGAAT